MMEKNFVMLNEKELESVSGGRELTNREQCEFVKEKTAEDALAYLQEKDVTPRRVSFYMNEWRKRHE